MQFKLGKYFLKFNPALVTVRNSTLLCIKINIFRLANAMHKGGMGDSKSAFYKKMMKWWEKVGGKPSVLLNAIKTGMKVEYKHHKNSHSGKSAVFNFDGVDSFAPAVAAPAVAASPFITQIMAMLKSVGIDTTTLKKGFSELKKKGVSELIASGKKRINKTTGETEVVADESLVSKSAIGDHEKAGISTPVMLGAAALILFLLTKLGKK